MIALCLVVSALSASNPPEQRSLPTATEVLDHIDDLYRGEASYGMMRMKVITEHWSRTLELEAWSKGKKRSLVRILAPKKEKGMATLMSGDDIWNFLPKVQRVIKIPSSMMSGSWMGSHFSNDDLIKQSRMAEDYNCQVTTGDQEEQWQIICEPKPDAAVVWGKLTIVVREKDWLPLKVEYFDEDGILARTMTFSAFKTLSGRLLPAITVIQPADKPQERTEVHYERLDFDIVLQDRFFSLRRLQR